MSYNIKSFYVRPDDRDEFQRFNDYCQNNGLNTSQMVMVLIKKFNKTTEYVSD